MFSGAEEVEEAGSEGQEGGFPVRLPKKIRDAIAEVRRLTPHEQEERLGSGSRVVALKTYGTKVEFEDAHSLVHIIWFGGPFSLADQERLIESACQPPHRQFVLWTDDPVRRLRELLQGPFDVPFNTLLEENRLCIVAWDTTIAHYIHDKYPAASAAATPEETDTAQARAEEIDAEEIDAEKNDRERRVIWLAYKNICMATVGVHNYATAADYLRVLILHLVGGHYIDTDGYWQGHFSQLKDPFSCDGSYLAEVGENRCVHNQSISSLWGESPKQLKKFQIPASASDANYVCRYMNLFLLHMRSKFGHEYTKEDIANLEALKSLPVGGVLLLGSILSFERTQDTLKISVIGKQDNFPLKYGSDPADPEAGDAAAANAAANAAEFALLADIVVTFFYNNDPYPDLTGMQPGFNPQRCLFSSEVCDVSSGKSFIPDTSFHFAFASRPGEFYKLILLQVLLSGLKFETPDATFKLSLLEMACSNARTQRDATLEAAGFIRTDDLFRLGQPWREGWREGLNVIGCSLLKTLKLQRVEGEGGEEQSESVCLQPEGTGDGRRWLSIPWGSAQSPQGRFERKSCETPKGCPY